MKHCVIWVIVIMAIVSILLSGCSCGEVYFSNIEVGKIFMGSRDGYFEKLPHNYCLDVDLGSTTRLFKVADEFLNTPWSSSAQHDEYILKGHYIKGFYNNNFLILCEEKSDNSYVYWSFDFFSQNIESYASENDVYEIYRFNSNQWSTLSNTNAQILAKDGYF